MFIGSTQGAGIAPEVKRVSKAAHTSYFSAARVFDEGLQILRSINSLK